LFSNLKYVQLSISSTNQYCASEKQDTEYLAEIISHHAVVTA